MIVLQSVWTEGRLHLWAESARGAAAFASPVEDLNDEDESLDADQP